MNAEWQNFKLGDICDFAKDRISLKNLSDKNYISTENLLPNKCGLVTAASLPKVSTTSAFKIGDVLVSNIRPYFKKIFYATFNGGCSNDVLVFRAKNNIDSLFLYYVLSEDKFFDYSTATSKGTKMPRGDKKAIMNYSVKLPPLKIQKKIATVLSSLDDKIELNNRINDNLEQQAQAIFKYYFIDFEPFGGTMPDDWKKGNLTDIANFLNGLAMQKYRPADDEFSLPVLKIKELRQGFCDNNSDLCTANIDSDYIISDGDVIFSWSATLLIDFWCGGICGLNQHLFKITSNQYNKWFYYLWTKYHLNKFIKIAADKATTMGHIKREDLTKAIIMIPAQRDYIKINNLLSPIYEMIILNRIENRKLSIMRDSLLPKLMSGKIDVSKIEL